MSEETTNHGHAGHGTAYEREDLSTRSVFIFMIGLAIIGLVIYFIINGMYSFLDKYEHQQMTTASPLSTSTEASSRKIDFAPGQDYVERRFSENGAPMLENNERTQFRGFLLKQEQQLNSYGWVDEKAGIAHIPIARAMDLIAKQGLPVLPQGATEAKAAMAPKARVAKPSPKQ